MPFDYRLALDLGPTSLGWAVFRLNENHDPIAIVLAGARIFSDGRNPKNQVSLAADRRQARSMRRRRDRLLKRKNKLMAALVEFGFFPSQLSQQKTLEKIDPYRLRAEGLDRKLTPHEFGRALFHLNQRRGFKSNRKTDKKEVDSSVMKNAISEAHAAMQEGSFRTVGEWLNHRMQRGEKVRARFHQSKKITPEGKAKIEKYYDLYLDRSMTESEFDALWASQSGFNPQVFHEQARLKLRDILLFQRRLRPVDPGRCTFYPDEARAPLALPSVQRFRVYQEVNHLRWLDDDLKEQGLTLEQRDAIVQILDASAKQTFHKLRQVAGLNSSVRFSVQDAKREELKGNITSGNLSKKQCFGQAWSKFSADFQDEIVMRLLTEENETELVAWLVKKTGVDEQRAKNISNVSLPSGYGRIGLKATRQILAALQEEVCTYDKAVIAAGIDHHSNLGARAIGEILPLLPYYGQVLQRHVGFGTGNPEDSEERKLGRISNPTVHIGLNQVRVVVNELIRRYGHPSEVVVELARKLKLSQERRREIEREQAENQKRNYRRRKEIADILDIDEDQVKYSLIQKMILWEELSFDPLERRCPYSGAPISLSLLLSDQVEIEHILPFSRTLDDGLNNKTISMREANRIKGNKTPWEAFGNQDVEGYDYQAILQRAQMMPRRKRYRFAIDGIEQWEKNDKGFLARALNDTSYLSRLSREYLEWICPQGTWVVPGQLTGMQRHIYGLNSADILGWNGQKNREDHRHHAIDACVIGVTDRRTLQIMSVASSNSRKLSPDHLLSEMPLPWPTYRDHVRRAVGRVWVSHKPDHSYEKAMHQETAYGILPNGYARVHKIVDNVRELVEERKTLILISNAKANTRHGVLSDGSPKPYKGYDGNSNYCIEVVRDNKTGKWQGEVISTYQAYQIIRQHGAVDGWRLLRNPNQSLSGRPLVMRLMIGDSVRIESDEGLKTCRVATIKASGQVILAEIHEANTDARNRDKENSFTYITKFASSLAKAKARRVTISPAGRLFDPGFVP